MFQLTCEIKPNKVLLVKLNRPIFELKVYGNQC